MQPGFTVYHPALYWRYSSIGIEPGPGTERRPDRTPQRRELPKREITFTTDSDNAFRIPYTKVSLVISIYDMSVRLWGSPVKYYTGHSLNPSTVLARFGVEPCSKQRIWFAKASFLWVETDLYRWKTLCFSSTQHNSTHQPVASPDR